MTTLRYLNCRAREIVAKHRREMATELLALFRVSLSAKDARRKVKDYL